MKVILASQSPRRAALMDLAKIDFEVTFIEILRIIHYINRNTLNYGSKENYVNRRPSSSAFSN